MSEIERSANQKTPDPIPVQLTDQIFCEPFVDTVADSMIQISDTVEISAVVAGDGIHRILNQVTECHTGDVYIFNGNVPHRYYAASENARPRVITLRWNASTCFSGDIADPNSPGFCYGVFKDRSPISYSMLNSSALKAVTELYAEMQAEAEKRELSWEQAISSRLSLLLIMLARYINMAETDHEERPKEWLTVSMAAREIIDRYSESDLTLESVSASLYISKSQLSRVFQKVMGVSFSEYVRNVRINMACRLLKDTELTNEEIIGRCGLKDVPSFYRIFNTVTGMTPFQYRSLYHSNSSENAVILSDISETLQFGNLQRLQDLLLSALDRGISAELILEEGLLPGINSIGKKFKNNEVYVPEVLVAARSMNSALNTLRPYLANGEASPKGTVCIGTVQGDLHDIGKNLVRIMMESKGLKVIDLGTDVSPERFVSAAIENGCQAICCSALLTSTMGVMEDVVHEAERRGVRHKIKIIIGGAPISEEFCREIGADIYTPDAASAADAAIACCAELNSR
ncbi:MAG: cobalamin-dependent protein [Clostridia bacterium]|nr:cobalamin-dependent protein [Clostridia bacterium]